MELDDEIDILPYDSRRYEKDHHAIRDTGVRRVLGLEVIETYYAIRRFVWRAKDRGHPAAIAMRDKGVVVVVKSQKALADYTGRSYKNTKKDIATLKTLGWLRVEQLDASTYAFVLGYLASEHGERPDRHSEEVFYADIWMRKLWTAIVKWAVDEQGVPFHETSMDERRAFCERYVDAEVRRHGIRVVA